MGGDVAFGPIYYISQDELKKKEVRQKNYT